MSRLLLWSNFGGNCVTWLRCRFWGTVCSDASASEASSLTETILIWLVLVHLVCALLGFEYEFDRLVIDGLVEWLVVTLLIWRRPLTCLKLRLFGSARPRVWIQASWCCWTLFCSCWDRLLVRMSWMLFGRFVFIASLTRKFEKKK